MVMHTCCGSLRAHRLRQLASYYEPCGWPSYSVRACNTGLALQNRALRACVVHSALYKWDLLHASQRSSSTGPLRRALSASRRKRAEGGQRKPSMYVRRRPRVRPSVATGECLSSNSLLRLAAPESGRLAIKRAHDFVLVARQMASWTRCLTDAGMKRPIIFMPIPAKKVCLPAKVPNVRRKHA